MWGAGTLLVAATGKPFPVALLSDKGGPNSEFVFGSYNSAAPRTSPAGAVDLPELVGPGHRSRYWPETLRFFVRVHDPSSSPRVALKNVETPQRVRILPPGT